MPNLIRPDSIQLKDHPEITERVIQNKIADDPTILGLGNLVVKDLERKQPHAGRLDMLLKDPETDRRYEVEIQLGKVNESHIIRTLEYWDIERKRYPQYEHCAVIIAEEITSRFLNVISLFNGFIPLIAIQMNAYKFGDDIALVFTKILDEMPLGPDDEEAEVEKAVVSRADWIKKWSEERVHLADSIRALFNEVDGPFELVYTKGMIAFTKAGVRVPYARLVPRTGNRLALALTAERSDDIDSFIETHGLTDMGYNPHRSRYRVLVTKEDLAERRDALMELFSIIVKQYEE